MNWTAIWVTCQLASLTSLALLVIGLPIAYWLTFSKWRWKFLIESIVALPLVLPPTVLGFYILVAMSWVKAYRSVFKACWSPQFYTACLLPSNRLPLPLSRLTGN